MNIIWKKEYNVNVLEIDEQYQNLVASFNDLVRLVKRGAAEDDVSSAVERVHSQSQNCFRTEELYFKKLGFGEINRYHNGHTSCLLKLNLFKQSYDQNQPLINLAHVEGIARALLGHVANSHIEFNHFRKENGLRSFIRAHA